MPFDPQLAPASLGGLQSTSLLHMKVLQAAAFKSEAAIPL
jgi:hypothetical protein